MNVQRGSKDRRIKALQWNKTQMIDACTDTRPVLKIGFHKEEVKGKRLFSWTSHCGFIKRNTPESSLYSPQFHDLRFLWLFDHNSNRRTQSCTYNTSIRTYTITPRPPLLYSNHPSNITWINMNQINNL